ncbi:MAG TPA: DUF2203 domain-containing protein [Candidatus Polarisedimenticolia bacterium]|nr:DUF2203 domain-containing protein [Candidatus Polarisedimenticolia bacterium]
MTSESRETKLFTVKEAQDVIEKIRPLVDQMLLAFAGIREEIETAARESGLPSGDKAFAQHLETRGVAPRLLQEINGTIQAIQQHGCIVNGPEAGLVDFPCLLGNEIVFLCWKSGETRVGHWHRIPDGFAGRRALLDRDDPNERVSSVH